MNGIGENKLIAFLAGLATLGVIAWQVPDKLSEAGMIVLSLFSILLGRKKEEKTE